MSATASTRVAIQWSGEEAFEDTDTLVLTINEYSLDLRVFNSGPEQGQVDWSTVAFVKEIEGSTKDHPILQWDHILDSRPPTSLPDQGTFTTLANGDVEERGRMFNPKTKLYQDYIETWRRFSSSPGEVYCVLEKINSAAETGHTFLGKVGDRSLGISKSGNGAFAAWREEVVEGKLERVYETGNVQDLPSLPAALPADWVPGAQVSFGGQNWIIRVLNSL